MDNSLFITKLIHANNVLIRQQIKVFHHPLVIGESDAALLPLVAPDYKQASNHKQGHWYDDGIGAAAKTFWGGEKKEKKYNPQLIQVHIFNFISFNTNSSTDNEA